VFTVAFSHQCAALLHIHQGDWGKARSRIEKAIAMYRTGNFSLQLPNIVAHSAWTLAQLGETTEALNQLQEVEHLIERDEASGFRNNAHSLVYHALGRAALLLSRLDEARSLGDRSLKYGRSNHAHAAHALHLLGDIATHPEHFDVESGETYYRQALALAEPLGMRPLVAHCHLGLGKLYQRTGKRKRAREHLTIAISLYGEMDMSFYLKHADAAHVVSFD
jgi:tetratricopeptide (TPR) repeat protein